MNYFWLISFLGISTGVLISPVFLIVSLFCLLFLFKQIHIRVYAAFVIIGALLAMTGISSKEVEIVGLVVNKKPSYVMVTNVKVYADNRWHFLNHQVKIRTKDLNTGEQVYAYGKLSSSFSYPRYTLEPIFCAGLTQSTRGFSRIISTVQRLKEESKKFIQDTLGELGKIMNGLLFSEGEFDRSESTQLRQSGLAHLFAVSGLHVGIIYALSDIIISFFTYRFLLRRLIGCSIALIFALSTGPTASAFRAATMLIVWNFFKIIDYPIKPFNVLGLVGTVNLLIEPYSILSASFLMSYSATGMILAVQEKINKLSFLWKNLSVSTAAFIGVAPFLSIFSSLNLLTPLISAPATFLVTPIIWIGFLSVILRILDLHRMARVLLLGATPLVYLLEKITKFCSIFPNLSLGLTGYILFSMLIFLLLWHLGHRP
ncbi:MAG TPA: ComEC/Rec2 family competence protein [Pseudothermotoga sp.]|nr:ComEC/Rec2 family competence protein [Pseudothermotoga sp.]HOK83917.1 ComEC/Rec2 family competence protein [Pseudothermotoga sp.]HPP70697.1 ComEC/Rec2 family competence protein [Pseudothermotoga sp.]